ncbi:MAG: class I SAM-dependent methyltransferase [bacterium]
MYLLHLALLFFLIAALIAFVVFSFISMWALARARVPYVPLPSRALESVRGALCVGESSVVYDIGCGDGKVLFYLAHHAPTAHYIGVENSPLPVLLARIRALWHRLRYGTRVDIVNGDFFKHDFSRATHIFIYLFPSVMDELLPILERSLTPGTRLVSATFKFKNKKYKEEVNLAGSKYKLARTLYIYEF